MTPEHKKSLEDLGKSSYAVALEAFLEEEMAKLDAETYKEVERYWAREGIHSLVDRLFAFMSTRPQLDKKKIHYN